MNLIQMIEVFEPNHFRKREESLERLRIKAKELGFFPLPLKWKDIECYWISLEPNEEHNGKTVHFQYDYIDDPYILEVFKKVAKYEKRG